MNSNEPTVEQNWEKKTVVQVEHYNSRSKRIHVRLFTVSYFFFHLTSAKRRKIYQDRSEVLVVLM